MFFAVIKKTALFFLLILSLSCLISMPGHTADPFPDVLTVGIYDNPPKLFMDADQNAKGIFPGIITHIATKEGWNIKFIPVTFKQGLDMLKNGSLDIMQDVAWSEQRNRLYDFTNETVMVSWGRVYKRKDADISTLIDLQGKRIALMDGGIYSDGPDGLKQIMKRFELYATFIPVNSYKEVFQTIDQGLADAGIVNRLYGKKNKDTYDIENTPILISPISIRFAFNKKNPATPRLISTIDAHLVKMKKDNNSVYYQFIDQYIRDPKTIIPGFLQKLLWALFLMSAFFAVLGIFSSWQVRKKTALLQKRDQELKESEKKFRNIFENLQDVYFKTALTGEIMIVSPSIEILSGFKPNELIGRNVDMVYYNVNDRQDMIEQLLSNGQVRDYQIRLKKKDQQPYWVSINADLFCDDQKNPLGITGILRDITQQKQIAEQLIQRKDRFEQMAQLLPCGIVETDIDLNIEYTNQAGLDIFGYTWQDIENGLNAIDIVHPDDWEDMLCRIERHSHNEPTDPSEYRMFKKDGTILNILYNSNAIIRNHIVVGFRGSLVDLTEIKQLQKEVIRNQKLESTGILAGGIAHDFNNILLGLFGNLSLAKKELSSDSKAYHLVEEAGKSMARAEDLTTQLLTFARGGDPVKKDISLGQLVRETALFHLSGSNIKFHMEKPETLWQVHADKSQIGQVIANLVINARQAMPKGGQLSIHLENVGVSGKEFSAFELDHYVKLSIIDQGVGIPEKYLEKIFDPYFTTKEDGSGLGLAVVHSIILKHQGYISVNANPDKGTTFIIYLPAVLQKGHQDLEKPTPARNVNIGPCRILVMDDDALVRDVSTRMLVNLGHVVELCEDGQSAVQLYQAAFKTEKQYDLVIMDLTIPGGLGGKDAVEKLLAFDPDARVILSSGYSTDPIMAHYKKYGFKAMITKPYTVEGMENILYQVLSE